MYLKIIFLKNYFRYIRTNSALKNYAHIFAIMMRLRQLSCHRDLLPIQWQDVNLNDLEAMIKELHQGRFSYLRKKLFKLWIKLCIKLLQIQCNVWSTTAIMKEFIEWSWILKFLPFFSGEDEESAEDTERANLLAEKLRDMIREGNF